MTDDAATLFDLPVRNGETVVATLTVGEDGRIYSASIGRANFLAGMIATWRYDGSPTKQQAAAARELAAEFARRIEDLP